MPVWTPAVCAAMSPCVVSGRRTFLRMMFQTSRFFLPASKILHGRKDQALLVHLRRVAGHRARSHAADVVVMAAVPDEADELALPEDGREDGYVGEVRAAGVGVVHEEDVAGLHVLQAVLRDPAFTE